MMRKLYQGCSHVPAPPHGSSRPGARAVLRQPERPWRRSPAGLTAAVCAATMKIGTFVAIGSLGGQAIDNTIKALHQLGIDGRRTHCERFLT